MNPNETLKLVKDALQKAIEEKRQNQEILRSLGPAIVDALTPALRELASNSKMTKDELVKAVQGLVIKLPDIKVPTPEIKVNVPDVKVTHEVNIPEIKVPPSIFNFDASKIRIPDIQMPDEMNVKGFISLMGYDRSLLTNPIPVQLRDSKGNPLKLFDNLTQIIQGSSGGKNDFFTIKGYSQSAFAEITNPDGRLKVELPTGSSGLTDAELRAAHLDTQQVSGAVDSVYVQGMATSSFAEIMNPDGRVKVELPSGSSGLTDTELRAASLLVNQLSGAIWSVFVTGFGASVGATILNGEGNSLDPRDRNWALSQSDEITQKQISGAVDSVFVQGFSVSVGASILNGDGAAIDPRGRTWNLSQTDEITQKQISGAVDSVVVNGFLASVGATMLNGDGASIDPRARVWNLSQTDEITQKQISGAIDSVFVTGFAVTVGATPTDPAGIPFNNDNPVPIKIVSGALTSTVAVGDDLHDAVDTGGAPLKVGGIAMNANPTKVSGGDRTAFRADLIGRQITRPIQVRDLIQTAYASLTNGTETTLLAGVASTFLDLIYIMGANNSDVAVQVDIRSGTGGSVIMTLEIPANGTAGVSLPVPLPQEVIAGAWTADMPDITGTTVYLSALFSKEV